MIQKIRDYHSNKGGIERDILFISQITLLYLVTLLLGNLIPKKKKLVLLSARKGLYYYGNAQALFEYLQEDTSIESYYFISNKKLLEKLSSQNKNIVYSYSWKGIRLFLRARTICFTHGEADFLGFTPSIWQNWIYLGHGGGTKARGDLANERYGLKKVLLYLCKFYYFVTTSDYTKYLLCTEKNLSPSRVYITGFPRTDTLYRNARKKQGVHNILYAPTHRKDEITKLFPFKDFDLLEINKLLKDKNIKLTIRFHPNNYKDSKKAIKEILDSSDKFVDKGPNVVQDPQELLSDADILITDFSSISRDYLFLDRPIIFITNGLNKLGNLAFPLKREFMFPGYQVETFKEFMNALGEILEGKDKYAEIRKFVRNLQYNYIDDQACARVVKLIKELA